MKVFSKKGPCVQGVFLNPQNMVFYYNGINIVIIQNVVLQLIYSIPVDEIFIFCLSCAANPVMELRNLVCRCRAATLKNEVPPFSECNASI